MRRCQLKTAEWVPTAGLETVSRATGGASARGAAPGGVKSAGRLVDSTLQINNKITII